MMSNEMSQYGTEPLRGKDSRDFILASSDLEGDTLTFYSHEGRKLGVFIENILQDVSEIQASGIPVSQAVHQVLAITGRPHSGKTTAFQTVEQMTNLIGIRQDNVALIKWDDVEREVRLARGLPTDKLDALPDEALYEVNKVLEDSIENSLGEKLLTVVEMPFTAAANMAEHEDEEVWAGRILGEPALLHSKDNSNPRLVKVNLVGLAPGPTLYIKDPAKRKQGAPPETVDEMFNLMKGFAFDLLQKGKIDLPPHIARALPGLEEIYMEDTDTFFQDVLKSSIDDVSYFLAKHSKARRLHGEFITQRSKLIQHTAQSLASLYLMRYVANQLGIDEQNTYIGLMNPYFPKILREVLQEKNSSL